ncbi:hypothetical protein [Stenotrophomonas phage BUCTxx99]|nr:hypothetical protein [Stenotrophomonas phage BUCTxx99]
MYRSRLTWWDRNGAIVILIGYSIIMFGVAIDSYMSHRARMSRYEVQDAAQKSLQPSPDALHCDCRSATQRPRNQINHKCPGGKQ